MWYLVFKSVIKNIDICYTISMPPPSNKTTRTLLFEANTLKQAKDDYDKLKRVAKFLSENITPEAQQLLNELDKKKKAERYSDIYKLRRDANTRTFQDRNKRHITRKISPTRLLTIDEDTDTHTLKIPSHVRKQEANRLAKEFVNKLFAKKGGNSKRATLRNKNKQ